MKSLLAIVTLSLLATLTTFSLEAQAAHCYPQTVATPGGLVTVVVCE